MAALRVFAGCALAMAGAGGVAAVTHQPWLFPSLGPAAMLHLQQPTAPESSPRNTLIGHAVALAAGYGSLALCGLTRHRSALEEAVSGRRIVAVATSLAVTALVLLLLRAPHAPAGATTLIVSLGLLHRPSQLLIAAGAVVLVTAIDWVFSHLTGAPMPRWRPDRPIARATP